MIVYLDTHVVTRIYEDSKKKLTPKARRTIENASEVRVSPAVLLELQILREIGRLNDPPLAYISELGDTFPFHVCNLPFAKVVETAESLGWTRDPFDRLIVAQTMLGRGELLTIDGNIRAHFTRAIWD